MLGTFHRCSGALFFGSSLRTATSVRGMDGQQSLNLITIGHIQDWGRLENPDQILVRIQVVFLSRFNQAEINGAGLSPAWGIREEKILPGYNERLNTAFTGLSEYSHKIICITALIIRAALLSEADFWTSITFIWGTSGRGHRCVITT